MWTGRLEPLPAVRRDLFWSDHSQALPILRSIRICSACNDLENISFYFFLSQFGHVTIVHSSIVKIDRQAKLAAAEVQDNLFTMFRMFELESCLKIVELYIC